MKRTRRSRPNAKITAREALSLLESAVSYCQLAGLQVSAVNGDNGTLELFIPNAHYLLTKSGTRAMFQLTAQDKPMGVAGQEPVTRTCPNCDGKIVRREDGTFKCTRCYFYINAQ